MTETNLSQAIEVIADASDLYDTNMKFLLADKQILSRILKYSVKEFQDMSFEDIMAGIGDDIEIGTRPIDPGLTNLGRVRESKTEDNIPGEGKIFFDIRFTAYIKEEEIKFLMNLEAQKSSEPGKLGYHLENRILFYLARMISAQKQTEFYHSDYDNLKRVRSIWICTNGRNDGDTIEEISLIKNTVFGNKSKQQNIDLLGAVIINVRAGEDLEESSNRLISMLESLFSKMDINKKKHILTEKYGMVMTAGLEGRITTMCNLSEVLIARSMEQGIEKGILGMVSAMRDLDIPDSTILQKLQEKFKISKEESQKYLSR